MMSKHENRHGMEVEWRPRDEDLAAEAIAETEGTGYSDPSNVLDDAPVRLDEETHRDVKDEYDKLRSEEEEEEDEEEFDTEE